MAKPLLVGLTYPYDWGFIPSTRAEDGDPLDVLIIHDAATYPGLVLKCKPVGVLEVVQTSTGKKERNDRVFVVPDRSPFEGDLQDIRRLPSRAIEELEKFFEATDALESIAAAALALVLHAFAVAIDATRKVGSPQTRKDLNSRKFSSKREQPRGVRMVVITGEESK